MKKKFFLKYQQYWKQVRDARSKWDHMQLEIHIMAKQVKIMVKGSILIYDASSWCVYQKTLCAFTRQVTFHMILGQWN